MRKSAVVCVSVLKSGKATPAGGLMAKEGTVGLQPQKPNEESSPPDESGRHRVAAAHLARRAIAPRRSSSPQNRRRPDRCF